MKTLKQLMQLNRRPGGDDAVADHLDDEGESARTELIRLLDSNLTSREEAGFITRLLELHFHSPESTAAIERYAASIEDPRARDFLIRKHQAMAEARRNAPDIWNLLPDHLRELCKNRDRLPEHIRKRLPKPPKSEDQ